MQYELIVETLQDQNSVKLRLTDEHGQFKAANEVTLTDDKSALWEGLFDTREHVKRYEGNMLWENTKTPETAEQILNRIGVFLGQVVLGQDIFSELTKTHVRRTLAVKVPSSTDNLLAAAFARVPWEIARPASDQPALTERGLAVRVITQDIKADAAVLQSGAVGKDEHIRILMVYAEAFGSTPLAMRQEREQLLNLFYKKILPRKRIQVDALCYGVTQSVLKEQIKTARGYHILHWSGHGHHNLLEIQGEDDGDNYISGPELVQLFINPIKPPALLVRP